MHFYSVTSSFEFEPSLALIFNFDKIKNLGSKTKASYAGPQGDGPVVQLNTCRNGKTDGDETDKDCGGECAAAGFQCEANKKCKADVDCTGTIPCVDGVCGLDGLTQETAGATCKGIKLQITDSKNGFYWVTGP